jgi:hypothetical protein
MNFCPVVMANKFAAAKMQSAYGVRQDSFRSAVVSALAGKMPALRVMYKKSPITCCQNDAIAAS